MKYREHGDHPCVTEQCALLEPIFLFHVQSNGRMGASQILVGSSPILLWVLVKYQTDRLPESQCVEEVHVSGQVSEPCDGQEAAVGGPGDCVAMGCPELIQ